MILYIFVFILNFLGLMILNRLIGVFNTLASEDDKIGFKFSVPLSFCASFFYKVTFVSILLFAVVILVFIGIFYFNRKLDSTDYGRKFRSFFEGK